MQEFSIKDLESFTGIKAHTIRIWEQRYGLLAPDRSDGNVRRYTDKDLKFLLNVSLLSNIGYKISTIAKMSELEIQDAIQQHSVKESNEHHAMHILKISMLNYDESLFNQSIDQLIQEIGLERTFTEVLMPFMRQIGFMWQASVICPAQEHFISALVRQKILSQIDGIRESTVKDQPAFILYLPELEIHEISLLMTHYVLRKKGLRSVYLGQSVPFEDLKQVYQRLGDVVFVSIFTTNPSSVLISDYLNKTARVFGETNCRFLLTGNNLQGVKSPDPGIISIFRNLEDLILNVESL